jgi:hypothetical protein
LDKRASPVGPFANRPATSIRSISAKVDNDRTVKVANQEYVHFVAPVRYEPFAFAHQVRISYVYTHIKTHIRIKPVIAALSRLRYWGLP